MRVSAIALIVLAATFASAADAQAPKPSVAGRYTMSPTDGGFLRLDTETGAVAFCAKKAEQWACNAVDDNRGAALKELERLALENRDLKAELAEVRRLEAKSEPKSSKIELPTEEEVDRALSLMKRVIKEFKGLMEDEQPPKNKL